MVLHFPVIILSQESSILNLKAPPGTAEDAEDAEEKRCDPASQALPQCTECPPRLHTEFPPRPSASSTVHLYGLTISENGFLPWQRRPL